MAMLQLHDEDLREVRGDVDELEASEQQFVATIRTAEVRDLPDFCRIYREHLRGRLQAVQRIVCGRVIKVIIGGTPCRVLGEVIEFCDRVCPG